MSLTRRQIAVLAAAAGLAPSLAAAQSRQPIVIGHRGASGERPEHTRAAYDLAIDQGADFIEPDLVVTKDGALVARHENNLTDTTDVSARPQFAGRRVTKVIDGESVNGWFTEDFTLAELKTLVCRERLPTLRPKSAAWRTPEPILTFQEVIDIARAGSVRTARVIGIYPEMKHPAYFAGLDMPIEPKVASALRTNGYDYAAAAVFVQSFEAESLKTFRRLSRARTVQLMSLDPFYRDMLTPAGLRGVKAYADAVGLDQGLVLDLNAEPFPADTGIVRAAHDAGLLVHSWTARQENQFLPRSLQKGDARRPGFPAQAGNINGLLIALFMTRLDGVFSDFPGLAVKARTQALQLMARPPGRR
ncbi:MAG: glycerophosphodiester phosphodiesterase family protein [Caulobacteraceae bacterium]